MARAAEAEAARIAEQTVSAHAAIDAAEDAVFGPDNPGLVPAALADPNSRAARIDEALAQLDAEATADPDVRADRDDPPAHLPEATESVEPEPVPHDRAARIAQAQARIEAEVAAERAEREAMVRKIWSGSPPGEDDRPCPGRGESEVGRAPTGRDDRRLAGQARCPGRGRGRPGGPRSAGRRPVPVEQNARVRQARATLEKARAAEAARAQAEAQPAERMANITDPQSRIQPLRGGGWLQGYNCQALTAADGLILAKDVETSPSTTSTTSTWSTKPSPQRN